MCGDFITVTIMLVLDFYFNQNPYGKKIQHDCF